MPSPSPLPTDILESSRSSPPRFYRTLSVDAYLQSEGHLPNLDDVDHQDENDLTEVQLRELYDSEEIERFLNIFSHVTEVKLPESPKDANRPGPESSRMRQEDREWTPVRADNADYFPPTTSPPPVYSSLSEEIAFCYLLPLLPHPRPSAPPFTIGRLRLACQRLYLAILPTYGPFLSQIWELATWEDFGTSSTYCAMYWTLWWYNMLAPARPRRHREEISRADEFGEQVSARLSATSSSMTEMWRLFRLYDLSKKHKMKPTAKDKAKAKCSVDSPERSGINSVAPRPQDATVLDDAEDDAEVKDFKRSGLQVLVEIADFHERIRNVFIWRRSSPSMKYGVGLFAIFVLTLFPAKYISKLLFFNLGFLFWHLLPLFAALSPLDKKRLPPPLHDVPTDAEYAMELISQRITAGLPVEAAKPSKHRKKNRSTESLPSPPPSAKIQAHKTSRSEGWQPSVDWKKFGDRVASGKSAIQDLKRLKRGKPDAWPPRHPIIPGAIGIGQPQTSLEAHTYPCQHSAAPGLITLVHRTLYFTPLMSQNAKMIIHLSAVKGVKKVGLLKGLNLRWTDSSDGKQEKEEKFLWKGDDGYKCDLVELGVPWFMFFTPELLAKRDSGFGLLWLAATLGARSSFKKLPKRSVLTADITQLCDLISEPAEPLALRLSSNLMFGVVRVYKVKQEIFFTDVTNCVASLKKVVQDLRSSGALDGQLQMANPSARPSALTIAHVPNAAYIIDYNDEAFVVDWDEFLNAAGDTTHGSDAICEEVDEDFDPASKRKKPVRVAQKDTDKPEAVRKEVHTLDEHHEHLLSASFDLSFQVGPGRGLGEGANPSSSQADVSFDNFFPFSDGLEVGDGLGDDLARELGWAVSPIKSARGSGMDADARNSDFAFDDANYLPDNDFNFNAESIPMVVDEPAPMTPSRQHESKAPKVCVNFRLIRLALKFKHENSVPSSRVASQVPGASPATSFSRLLLSQDLDQMQPLKDITAEERNRENRRTPRQKLKRTRLLLDARTELTDEELKVARAKYLESQYALRREFMQKRRERDSGKLIEDLIWGVPKGIQEQGLINFWQENFKVQVEARSGALRIHQDDDAPLPKRRRVHHEPEVQEDLPEVYPDAAMDVALDWGMDHNADVGMLADDTTGFRHSSEEPGQARRVSRSASVLGANNLGFDLGPKDLANGSQRSSLFPWDNAGGPSSSTGNVPFGEAGSDHAIEQVDIRLRSNSLSLRASPLANSQRGSLAGAGVTFSPAPTGRSSQIFGEDFAFDVENGVVPEETQQDTQKSDLNLITLERNSYNFLEYAKMQYHTLPKPDDRLTFETVVPKTTSTRHVAAAAFYHCLVLGTKNLLRLEQKVPYQPVLIHIV
ncbi:hypothetical protein NLJ89_g2734 [Agrocybe chaxingu]|uniref:Uncharacterized protein n=1 Tax=Agrocybe chaxingu TaxID=84603 RepID=A0A9W8MYL6_9AGAR|nr:hypothetical protein NLJ89_g2734 [Agrocybe chaxingu]